MVAKSDAFRYNMSGNDTKDNIQINNPLTLEQGLCFFTVTLCKAQHETVLIYGARNEIQFFDTRINRKQYHSDDKKDGNSDRIAVPFRFDGRADEAGGLSALLRAARLTLLARGRIIVPTEALRGCYKRSRERETERCLVRLYWLAKMPATTAPP